MKRSNVGRRYSDNRPSHHQRMVMIRATQTDGGWINASPRTCQALARKGFVETYVIRPDLPISRYNRVHYRLSSVALATSAINRTFASLVRSN